MSKDELPEAYIESSLAVIGLAGRFPGARNIEEYWRLLRDGVDAITDFSDEELSAAGVRRETLAQSNYVKARGYLEGADLFDASFFGFTPREAEIMNPQHRLLLETAWEALEDAGYNPEGQRRPVGVFAGGGLNFYLLNVSSHPEFARSGLGWQAGLLNWQDTLTTNVSYKLNLRGPSLDVQTFCSTSLVAVHLACQSLLSGECDMALAGGVKVAVPLKAGYLYQEGGINPPDGRCRAFGAEAKGTASGSGVALVVLKRLAEALEDGDHIRAIIRGTAVNNDGSLKVGFTAPGVEGQARVIGEALSVAGVSPETITSVEAHGTGTPLGDPVEIAALTKAFGGSSRGRSFCAVGSVKSNFGHLDAAAGVAGLIKTVLSLENKMIPPSLHFSAPNPQIDFANSPFYVNTQLTPWEPACGVRRAGVSSFGIGGTNAHVVLEEAPARELAAPRRPWQLLCVSARTQASLDAATSSLARHLKAHPELELADVAHTLHVGRKAFTRRRFLICRDGADAAHALEALDPRRLFQSARGAVETPTVFLFPGGGAQYEGMARELYSDEPAFREEADRCVALLERATGSQFGRNLFEGDAGGAELLGSAEFYFPALFCIEYALGRVLMRWGVRPRAMIGHSLGEYVAACLAGVMSAEDALALLVKRGRLMQGTHEGGMLSVPLSEAEVAPLLGAGCSVAVVNTPGMCVVSGPVAEIDELERTLAARGVEARRLHISIAAHSAMMEPILAEFTREVRQVRLSAPSIPYVSNVTGTWVTPEEATSPDYWARHLRSCVRFSEGVGELLKQGPAVFVEVGPGHSLSTLLRQHPDRGADSEVVSTVRHPHDEGEDQAVLFGALGRLWLAGGELDWDAFYAGERRRRVPLPTYPFERQRFWVEAVGEGADPVPRQNGADARRKTAPSEWFYHPVWKRTLAPVAPNRSPQAERAEAWLIFGDEGGFGEKLARRLEREGREVYTVLAGERFGPAGTRAYRLRPDNREDYVALLGELRAAGRLPSVIVHAWGVARVAARSPSLSILEECLSNGFYSLLRLTQALAEQSVTGAVRIEVLTSGAQDVTGGEELCPEKVCVIGPGAVIRQEYSNLFCRSVDVTLPAEGTWREERLLDLLTAEFTSGSTDVVVAYRDEQRWVQGFERVGTSAVSAESGPPTLLRRGGVYLITGGLGRVGSSLARHLAREWGARLVLTGRTSLPERDEWARLVEAGAAPEKVSGRIRTLVELESLGAEVLAVEADVTDEQQMRRAVELAYERFGTLNGVIHAVKGEGRSSHLIPDMGRDEAENYFHPKARGVYVLEKVLNSKDLDFCLLTSTVSSVLGGLGLFSVTAANVLLDAFAQQQSRLSPVPWISVDWDFWRFGAPTAGAGAFGKTFAELGVTPQEGEAVFGRLLTRQTPPRIIVSTGDLHARIAQWVAPETEGRDDEPNAANTSRHPRPELTSIYVEPSGKVEQTVADIWQDLLGIDAVGAFDNFFELGGHSLLATQIITRLRETFQVGLPLRSLFESPTVRELAAVIEAALVKEIEKLSDEEAERLLQQEA